MLNNNRDINFISIRNKLFDASDKYHVLDYRFDKNKIVDILKEPTMLQTSSCNIVYRSEFIKKYRYEENIKYSEDAKFMSILLMDCSKNRCQKCMFITKKKN